MTTIKRDGEVEVRKVKVMYKQREKQEIRCQTKRWQKPRSKERVIAVTDSGQRGVRHELAELRAGACWNMCGAIGSAAWRR